MTIDLNRGCTIKTDPGTGARVIMYKDQPGVFLNAHGAVVADTLAARCGFPVKDLLRERRKREALAQSAEEIEAEFEEKMAVKTKDKVLAESEDGYKAVQRPFGRCWVYGPDEKPINDRPLTKEEALHLFKTINDTPDLGADAGSGAAGSSAAEAEKIEAKAPPNAKGETNGT